jgi:predicted nucleotidyltransferase
MTPAFRARIDDLANRIATAFSPERIVLFGSFAYGSPGVDSDVDLLVVMPCVGKPWRKAAEIRNRVRPEFPLDLLVRTPEQVAERVALGDGFVREILDRGTVLYEAPRG